MASRGHDLNEKVDRFGIPWSPLTNMVHVHMWFIQHGGHFKRGNGQIAGMGLFYHYSELCKLFWPEEDDHRWWQLCLKTILEYPIVPILGPKDSGKTHCMAKYGLMDYWCFPHTTLILISSTDLRGLEYRIWGDLKGLFERAKSRFDFLSGHLIDSKHAICTDNLQEEEVRDMRRGIVCIPCVSSNGQFVGLGKYVGMKQKRRRLLSDECQFMKPAFLDSLANLNSGDFKGVFVGNPLGEGDPLDKISEPKDGWNSINEPEKTTTWENKFEGVTINLVGPDSPNFDFPQDEKPKYPYLINQREITKVENFYGKNSVQYYSQVKGVRKTGLFSRKVIYLALCKQFGAMETPVWYDTKQTQIYAIDAAYGNIGGDRCIGGKIEFGRAADGVSIILSVGQPVIIPIQPRNDKIPEDQIAEFAKEDCERRGIPPENVFYDSTGRGSLGTSFARIWSSSVNPVEFGGNPTGRPVCADMMTRDEKTGQIRQKRCDEHYSKFVTELWFSARYTIESRQMRNLPMEVIDDASAREWYMVKGDKIELEPKEDTRKRTNRSPDLMDWLATAVEGARRLGFSIARMSDQAPLQDFRWKDELKARALEIRRHGLLVEL